MVGFTMFSPCSLETCGMLVPGGSFLGNREASQMRFHVGPFFFERWGSPNFFEFWCFEIIGECWVLSSYLDKAQKKKGHASETSFNGKDGLIASVPTIRSETRSHFSGQPRCCCSVHPCFRLVYRLCSWKLVWFAESQIWALFKAVFPRAAWRDLV